MSVWSNAVNATQNGVQSINSGVWTGSAVTQFNTLVGGAANAIANVAPGTAGFVLTSNGGAAAPTYQAVPGVVSELTWTNAPPYSSATFALAATVGAIASFAGAIAVTLPTSACAVGNVMAIAITDVAGLATITMGTGQHIQFGETTYSTSMTNTRIGDSLILLCTVAASGSAGTWVAIGGVPGNWGGT